MFELKNHSGLFIKVLLVLFIPIMSACQPSRDELTEVTLTPEIMAPEIVSGVGSSSSGQNRDIGQNGGELNDLSDDDSSRRTAGSIDELCSTIDEDSPCSNPYIPVIEGLRFQFSSADGEVVQYIEKVEDGGFTVIQEGPDGSSLSMDWECTPEGLKGFTAQDQLQGMLADFGGAYSDIEIDGVALPAGISVGDAWVMNVRIIVGVAQSGVDSRNTIDLELNFSAISEETISVPAGSFRALRVDYTTQGVNNLEITAPAGVYTQQLAVIEGSGSDWYVECLGRVKSISTSVVTGIADMRDERTMELLDFRLSD